jgi:iron transport multicopper oxidase
MHPATVGSSIFGILWKNTYNTNEKFYAKPLTFTPAATGKQLVFLASAMNIIRTVDAVTGVAIKSRTVQPPFLQSDIGCTDIPNYIGIIGTPIIDPTTETVYFFSKGYVNGASSGGVINGRYLLYGVNINTLQDVPGFPVLIDGHSADNDPTKYFVGGTVLQRPALTMISGSVIGAFGGHCDLFNYTGMLVAVSTTPNVGVTSIYAMEGGPAAQPEVDNYLTQSGGKAGIWQGGMGLATDGTRFFFATGNGQGHANGDIPASGRLPLTTLDEVVADIAYKNSKFSLTDYFEPYEYVSMDAADRDLGSGGVALLDPGTFNGAGVSRIAVSVGKNGKAYILNADNLGGFKQGPGGTDNILQTIIASGPVFGGSGSYPLEGGFIYFTPNGQPTVAYKLGKDDQGKPLFTLVGQTKTVAAGRVGIGIPTVTTYKGQPGTGILWVGDPNLGLQAFNAVPDASGTLTPITLPPTNGLNKFQRPAFGDGRVYVSDTNGNVYCLGSPVALALNCTQPVDFGPLAIGSFATVTVTCTALIPITKVNSCVTQDKTFQCSNSSLPQGPLNQGDVFSFPLTWNLTQASINDAQNASYGKVLPGPVSTSLDIATTNGVPKYAGILPVSVTGTTVSKNAFITVEPPEVDFGGIVVNGSGVASGLSAAIIVSNVGSVDMHINGVAWADALEDPTFHNITTNPDGSSVIGPAFSSTGLPKQGDTIQAGQSLTVPLNFKTNTVGAYQSILWFWSDGGSEYTLLTGSASTSPVVNISVTTTEGGFDYSDPLIMDFGNVTYNSPLLSRNIRICNSGGSALTITKSKPPIDPELFAARPLTDLHEGQVVDVNQCANGEIDIFPAAAVVNQPAEPLSDVWVLNADGISQETGQAFGVHEVQIKATILRRQVGPKNPDGDARYKYLGCFQDGNPRLLPKGYNINTTTMENGQCQGFCLAAGYIFAGTEYHHECWCGNTAPSMSLFQAESLKKCTFSCDGDTTQACGGNGQFISVFYDSTRYTPSIASSAVSSSSSSISSTISSTSSSSTTVSSSTSTTVSSSSSSSSTSTISPVSSTTTTTSTIPAATVAIQQTIGPYTYQGCYHDPAGGRSLPVKFANDSMTQELCATYCAAYTYFGVEYARECKSEHR